MRLRHLVLVFVVLILTPMSGMADDVVAVPVALQMELLTKLAGYDKNLPVRAPETVRVLVLMRRENVQSNHVAQQAVRNLEGKTVANRPIDVSTTTYADGPSLRARVKDSGVAIVYLTPGFGAAELEAIATALEGISVLSAGALPQFVQTGVVVGFDLVSSKPKILVHLKRARQQKVELSSQVLKLVKVVQ